ncbi:ATP-binding protein [Chryseobacterium sp.]|uniref:ATP-binding protein n=1 Tax=Chryseobacterium sp. TaxID=1871047 RepID=UPI0035C72C09
MDKKIFFIGGIHGVGKSAICNILCKEFNLKYLSASHIINWNDSKVKNVDNVSSTQNKLISGLQESIINGGNFLLDGHFSLINNDDNVENIPLETFEHIDPINLNLIIGDTVEISQRLLKRDGKFYEPIFLKKLQDCEISNAKMISEKLNVNLNICTTNDYSKIFTAFNLYLPKL